MQQRKAGIEVNGSLGDSFCYKFLFAVPASGLRDLKVYIPDTVLRGHNIQFNCTFTLEDEKLFAIKWYRGNYEIFRYIPSGDVPKKTFPLEGYNVSVSTPFLPNEKGEGFPPSSDYHQIHSKIFDCLAHPNLQKCSFGH